MRRLGVGHRKAIGLAEKIGAVVVVAGRQLVDAKRLDAYVQSLPNLTGWLSAREAGKLLGCCGQHVSGKLAEKLGGQLVDGQYRFDPARVLQLAREREAERHERDRRRAKRENRRRDRGVAE